MVVRNRIAKVVAAASVGALVAATTACAAADSVKSAPTDPSIQNVVYFGNPTTDVQTLGDYIVTGTDTNADNKPFFDTVVLFAANINNSTGTEPTDPSLQDPVLEIAKSNLGGPNGEGDLSWIAPAVTTLHAKGITVLLGILPNHQGVGWSCPGMTTAAQQSLASKIAAAMVQYNLDGISIDDEYAECLTYDPGGSSPDGPGGDASVTYGILQALKKEPTFAGKVINKSTYIDAFSFVDGSGTNLAPLLDSAWTEEYPGTMSELSAVLGGGMKAPQLGLSASPGSDLDQGTPSAAAASAVSNGLGYMMIWATDSNSGIAFTPQERAAWYTSALQGEFGSNSVQVVYQPSQ